MQHISQLSNKTHIYMLKQTLTVSQLQPTWPMYC